MFVVLISCLFQELHQSCSVVPHALRWAAPHVASADRDTRKELCVSPGPPAGPLSHVRDLKCHLPHPGHGPGARGWPGSARVRPISLDAGLPPVGEDPRASQERHPFTVKSCPRAIPFLSTMGEASWAPGPRQGPLRSCCPPPTPPRGPEPGTLLGDHSRATGKSPTPPTRTLPECPWKPSPALAKEKSGFKGLSNPGRSMSNDCHLRLLKRKAIPQDCHWCPVGFSRSCDSG